jgi:hypothetical protein
MYLANCSFQTHKDHERSLWNVLNKQWARSKRKVFLALALKQKNCTLHIKAVLLCTKENGHHPKLPTVCVKDCGLHSPKVDTIIF